MRNLLLLFFAIPFCFNSANGQDYIFWGDQIAGTVHRSDLLGGNDVVLRANVEGIRRLRVDHVNEKLYWVEGLTGKLFRADYDGGNEEVVFDLDEQLGLVEIDSENGRIFYVAANDKIMQCNLSGNMMTTAVDNGGGAIQDIAMDIANGKLYYTDYVAQEIKRANLDGSNIEVVLAPDASVFGLALDEETETLYFTERNTGNIGSVKTDGSAQTLIVNVTNEDPRTLSLDRVNQKIYWVNSAYKLYRSDMDGSNPEIIIDLTASGGNLAGVDVVPTPLSTSVMVSAPSFGVKCYPNPVGDELFVDLSGVRAGSLELVTVDGRVVLEGRVAEGTQQIDLSGLASGVYYVRIVADGEVYTELISK